MNEDRQKFAKSFGSVADAYDNARPDYPAAAADWLVHGAGGGSDPRTVLELGAGTGLLTERLTGHRLIATDPAVEMLAKLRERLPRARVLASTAEQIPLPSRTFDIVVAAQAFHWFDHPVAFPEMARVLRPDGHLALVWNIPDESTPWVRKLQRIVPRPVSHDEDMAPMRETPYFGFVEEQTFRSWKSVTRDDLLNLIRSRSPFAVADEDTKASMLEQVSALYDDYDRGFAGLQMPYVTRCYRARGLRQDAIHSRGPAPRPGQGRNRPKTPSPAAASPTAPPAVPPTTPPEPPEDDATLLIDFR